MRFWITYGAYVFFFAYSITQLITFESGNYTGLAVFLIPLILSSFITALVVSLGLFGSSSHSGYGNGGGE
ncbi:hypothetical protein CTI30_18625 [Bacillus velezensis]|nr:hypothetical protein AAV29_10645 [Bacillus velezensis]MCP1459561.1 hypothetical protein [Bacillus amyloliquefaciens]MVZ95587.1 hypothetical protein [Bacillus velezensis]